MIHRDQFVSRRRVMVGSVTAAIAALAGCAVPTDSDSSPQIECATGLDGEIEGAITNAWVDSREGVNRLVVELDEDARSAESHSLDRVLVFDSAEQLVGEIPIIEPVADRKRYYLALGHAPQHGRLRLVAADDQETIGETTLAFNCYVQGDYATPSE